MDQTNSKGTTSRALGLSVLGVLVALAGGFFAYNGYATQYNQASASPSSYEYTIKQSADPAVNYFDSSFFEKRAPSQQNNAYLSQLTDTVNVQFHYAFAGEKPASLTAAYSIKANVQTNYPLKGNVEEQSNVWQREYLLLGRTVETANGTTIALNPTVSVPYSEYRQAVSDLRTSLLLPTNSQVVITLNVQLNGTVEGTPFTDTRTSSVTLPLEDQIYQPITKLEKEITKQVVPETTKEGNEKLSKIQLYGGSALIIGGIALIIYGLRKRIFKSPYQRELDKIYRYHDGIIVRTSRPVDLADYQIIPMRSFDDMLNLEEELKTPIIADEISSSLTHFLIAHGNVMYLYKLTSDTKKPRHAPEPAASSTAREVLANDHAELKHVRTYGLSPALHAPRTTDGIAPKRPLGQAPTHRTPTAKNHDELDDIVSEMAKKPRKK